ncbi:MAG: hypothetical protein PHW25_06950 [Zoogloea sp.]|uniref:hypothetical protein n=1 Tax=Zoogloea sp. TaxID=49181 RepID=UPI00261BF784|nr:hypothetical protein [Zoogloea sp.]MDD3326805.1 hypothetical protein [Zoogloea sp.]
MPEVIRYLMAPLLLAAAACQAVDYPSFWPPVSDGKPGAACPDLDGAYKNAGDLMLGENDSKSMSSSHLGMELLSFGKLMSEGIDPKWADQVVLQMTRRSDLEVSLLEKGKLIYRTVLKKGESFSCTPKYLRMDVSSSGSSHIRVATRFAHNEIGKASDGSLIIRYEAKEYGLFAFLLPYRESRLWWYRFEPAPAPTDIPSSR